MRRTAFAAVAAVLLLAGCSGEDGSSDKKDAAQTPEQALAAAKKTLDETSGVHLTLASKNVDDTISGLLSGSGTLTDAPAFDGKIVVQIAGLKPEVPVIAVDGKVYAQLPLTSGWQDIDPTDYGAPDPAALMSPDRGLSSMLTATTDPKRGDSVRGGEGNKEVLTSYSGTLPASAAKAFVPSVAGDVDATYTLTADDQLREAVLTGDFYGTGASETYTVTVDDYGTEKDITAP
ncbi:lipoprotein LprG [Nocardioides terrae]|uniref:Lipoprotein LprG n=1 Tax=Nocardioides terrae TaxID=574651 RepID=A0A1I1FPA2_9ACTN|nr:LppX_LprAFG lipoprotein [Nocardioides terrae]SFC01144.1 lipoprotein LprG [Nocardioides terrae]